MRQNSLTGQGAGAYEDLQFALVEQFFNSLSVVGVQASMVQGHAKHNRIPQGTVLLFRKERREELGNGIGEKRKAIFKYYCLLLLVCCLATSRTSPPHVP